MRPLVKLELVDKIAQHLQARFVFSDLFDYLSEWQLPEHLPPVKGYVSKRVYSKDVIKYLPDAIILKIAEEL